MQVIYAAPFIMMSLVAFLVCLAIPPLRKYKLTAFLAPLIFAASSIITMVVIVVVINEVQEHYRFAFPWAKSGLGLALQMSLIYFVPGLVWTWIALVTLGKRTSFTKKSHPEG